MTLPVSITIRPTDANATCGTDPGSPTSGYLRYWLPLLGPATSLAYRRLLDATDHGRAYGYLDMDHLAHDIGLGRGVGAHSPLSRTWRRLQQFGLVTPAPDGVGTIDLPIHVPWLRPQQLDRLRPDLAILEHHHRAALENVVELHAPR